MFFRLKNSNSGKVLQLTESYRNDRGKSRQKLVVSLGNLPIPRKLWKIVAKAVEDKIHNIIPIPTLFNQHTPEVQEWIDYVYSRYNRKHIKDSNVDTISGNNQKEAWEKPIETIDGVIIDGISHSDTTTLGPELLGYYAWNELRMSDCLRDCGFNDSQINMAALSTISRLSEPMTENAIETDYLFNSSLPELMDFSSSTIGLKDRLYRVSDKLLKNSNFIENHLCKSQNLHFKFNDTIILYDLTNTHFEGICAKNSKAKRGKNKQKRTDCPQIVVGVIFNSEGFELGHKIFDGNQNDSKSLKIMLKEMNKIKGERGDQLSLSFTTPFIILDGGIATKGNLKYLRKNKYDYLVNDSRRSRGNYYDEFKSKADFIKIETSDIKWTVDVKQQIEHYKSSEEEPAYDESILLCCSEGRSLKEEAILSNAEERFLTELHKLKKQIKSGKLKDKEKITKRIGKLEGQHTRIRRYYTIKYNKSNGLTWQRKDEKYNESGELFGCYVLRSNRTDFDSETLWHLYMTLTKAEEGFKILKHNLGLRPNHHQIEFRVEGHVFLTIIAYHLLKFLLYKLELAGVYRSWESIRRLVQTHCYTTIKVPTKNGIIYTIRKAGEPDERQKYIYRMLDVNWKSVPQKREVVKMK